MLFSYIYQSVYIYIYKDNNTPLLRFGKIALHPTFEGKKHFLLLASYWQNFVKLIVKILCTNMSFV